MTRKNILAGITALVFALALAGCGDGGDNGNSGVPTPPAPFVPEYSLGDTGPGGGKIFYISEEGFTMRDTNKIGHYLEAAPADIATGLRWVAESYGDNFETFPNITGTGYGIGRGRENTALILATDAAAPAAKACDDYTNNGKTDWFLPSKDELYQLYVNRTSVGNLNTTEDVNFTDIYWSSSQHGNHYFAWEQCFSDGDQLGDVKVSIFSVRAVRAF